MKTITLLILLIILPQAQADNDSVFSEEAYRKIRHKNFGCPINSICSKELGLLINKWEKLINQNNKDKMKKDLRSFHKEHGLPVKFLTEKEVNPNKNFVLWNSRCRQHNPKNPNSAILRGMSFSKNIPFKNDEMHFDLIHLFEGKKVTSFPVNYQARPLLIKDERLFFLEDYDDFIYQTSIDSKGNVLLEDLPNNVFSKAMNKKVKEVLCPENKKEKHSYYETSYCQKIWDIDSNQLRTIQIFWPCT